MTDTEKCAVWLEDQNKEKYLVEAEKCYLYEEHFSGRKNNGKYIRSCHHMHNDITQYLFSA